MDYLTHADLNMADMIILESASGDHVRSVSVVIGPFHLGEVPAPVGSVVGRVRVQRLSCPRVLTLHPG